MAVKNNINFKNILLIKLLCLHGIPFKLISTGFYKPFHKNPQSLEASPDVIF
jgi:hypothetical protein